jgi:hypothetical protein
LVKLGFDGTESAGWRPCTQGVVGDLRIFLPGHVDVRLESNTENAGKSKRPLFGGHSPESEWLVKTSVRSWHFLIVLIAISSLAITRPARGQLSSTDEERLQILSDPEALKKTLEKDHSRAPFEFFRSQVAPLDVLPLMKPHHWSTIMLEMRANYDDYGGNLQSFPIALPGMPQEMVYARESRLVKEQRSRLGMQVMLPQIPKEKEMNVELVQPGAIRADELWQVPIRLLPPAQMLVVLLTKESSSQYSGWNRLPSLIPSSADREDAMSLELLRYYRLVLPEDVDKPFFSPHPLTWGPISHIVWDGLPPESISVSHQQAMLDWLHWGGQLVLVGGAGPTFSIFRESFLERYLPADPTGENQLLGESELKPLADAYPPTVMPTLPPDQENATSRIQVEPVFPLGRPYRRPVPIQPPKNRPVFVTGLRPRLGASTISLGEGSPHLLAVEGRVGRGRITMLTINPTEPSLVSWPGLDTLIRRVVLRRPEELGPFPPGSEDSEASYIPRGVLDGPDLSWYRITSRDAGAEREAARARAARAARTAPAVNRNGSAVVQPAGQGSLTAEAEEASLSRTGVAEWRDTTILPRVCRTLLEKAAGITVPSSQFVLKVILAYILAVVPLNWLVCRLLLNRREWAWIVVPLLALGFAIGVERMAAYDIGYDSACDEIDLLEVQGGYTRAHLSRFASIYSTGRGKYEISYPNDPTALALPFSTERSIGGEDVSTSLWQSYPVPALQSFIVQPRSLSMFRAEQMMGLAGSVILEDGEAGRTIVNGTDLELRDAMLVDFPDAQQPRETYLGTIGPGSSVPLPTQTASRTPAPSEAYDFGGYEGPEPEPLLAELRKRWENRPEDAGELRLVAWVSRPVGGQSFEPALDRHRGLTAVLVHLRYGNPPSPATPRYNLLAGAVNEKQAAPEENLAVR